MSESIKTLIEHEAEQHCDDIGGPYNVELIEAFTRVARTAAKEAMLKFYVSTHNDPALASQQVVAEMFGEVTK